MYQRKKGKRKGVWERGRDILCERERVYAREKEK